MGQHKKTKKSADRHRAKAKRATAGRSAIEQADAQAAALVAPVRHSLPVRMMSGLSEAADQPPLIALSATIAAAGLATGHPRLARAGMRMLAAHALATWAKGVIKNHVDRSRPRTLIEDGEYAMRAGDSAASALRSFPSGHTAGGVAVVRALAREYPASAAPAGAAMSAVAAALVPKQAHYPSDVAAGAAIGWLAEAVVDVAWIRLERHLPNRIAALEAG